MMPPLKSGRRFVEVAPILVKSTSWELSWKAALFAAVHSKQKAVQTLFSASLGAG